MLPILIVPDSGCDTIGSHELNKQATSLTTSCLPNRTVVGAHNEIASARIVEWWRWYCEFPHVEVFAIGCHGHDLIHPGGNESAKNLLADSERVLMAVARQWRKTLTTRSARSLAHIVGAPGIPVSPVLSTANVSSETIAWLLWCMSWWGMHDARSLFAKRLHPATRIVRWLSAAPLQLQEERSALTLRLLANTLEATRTLWRQVADRMRRRDAYLLDPRIIDVQFIWDDQKSIAR
jgi:hypothetical protein